MRKFTEEEIKEIIRAARVFAPQFNEEQYQKLTEMQQEMTDSEFIEAAWGMHHLEREYGIPCSQALDKYLQLLKDRAELESEVSRLKREREIEEKQLTETVEAVQQAKEEHSREEKDLKILKRQAEDEKKHLKEEVEHAVEEAQVNQREIAIAVRLNAEVESHGLDLELVLRLLGEFAGDEEAARHLAEAVVEYGSQLEARETLHQENEALKLEVQKRQEKSDELNLECQHQQKILSQFRSDVSEEEALRHFRKRFEGSSQLLEYLARWNQAIPMRCQWLLCGARFLVSRGPSHFRTNLVCPCCGAGQVCYDHEASIALGLPYGTPFRIDLGE